MCRYLVVVYTFRYFYEMDGLQFCCLVVGICIKKPVVTWWIYFLMDLLCTYGKYAPVSPKGYLDRTIGMFANGRFIGHKLKSGEIPWGYQSQWFSCFPSRYSQAEGYPRSFSLRKNSELNSTIISFICLFWCCLTILCFGVFGWNLVQVLARSWFFVVYYVFLNA